MFDTDDERNYLETTIRIRDGVEIRGNFNQKNERSLSEVPKKKEYEKIKTIIDILQEKGSISPKEAEATCKKSSATTRRYMKLLFL